MYLRSYLSSLRRTYLFMISFGLVMGVVFPFYSFLFFGAGAFQPLYVLGCLVAGFSVGTFCYYVIKQVMRIQLERQWQTLSQVAGAGSTGGAAAGGTDELQRLFEGYDRLLNSVLSMVEQVSRLIVEVAPLYRELAAASRELKSGNERQVKEVRRTREAVDGMHRSFGEVLQATEDLTTRTQNRARIAAELSGSTETIAQSIREYSAAVTLSSGSIAKMASSIRETREHLEGLIHSTEQTSSSILEISASIGNIRDNARRSSDCSESVKLQAQEGMRSMEATRQAMTEIERSSGESSEYIGRLAAKLVRIGESLNVIHEVVQQTNLLSLNAFIISAQAGEQGKSFSVVAQEIKSLALRTADSATEIDSLVQDIQRETATVQASVDRGMERVREGVVVTAQTAQALMRIEESASEASDMVRRIAQATGEQASGSRLITAEVEQNLSRGQQISAAVQTLEAGTNSIVATLQQLDDLARRISTSSEDQARGNRLYLASVQEDSEKAKRLKDDSLCQLNAADEVKGFLAQAGALIESNAEDASQMAARIEAIAELTEQLKQELAPFTPAGAVL